MSAITTDRDPASAEERRRHALSFVFFLGAAFAFLLRVVVTPEIMNKVMPYTTEGGSFPEKLHVGTYAVFLLLTAILLTRPIRLAGDDIRLFRATVSYAVFLSLLVAYLFATGRAGSAGFIIDSYLLACASVVVMLCLGEEVGRTLGNVILGMLILSAAIGTVEAVTQHRLMPSRLVELSFRPTGLASHPLELGALCGTAVGFVSLTRWRIWVRVSCILVLFVGAAASGARASLLLTTGEVLFLLLFLPWPGLAPAHRRQAKLFVLALTLAGGAALIAVLYSAGLLERFNNTIFDENYYARVRIYDVFDYVQWKDMLFGMNPAAMLKIVNEQLKLPYVESTPVVLTLLFGLPIALVFAAAFFRYLLQLLYGAPLAAWIASAIAILAALSNNGLSTKSSNLMVLFVLVVAYRKPARRRA